MQEIITGLISVIVPVYKAEPYLKKCVDSICAQTYSNLEILLVDDCSPDRCGEMCDAYAAGDHRVRAIHQSENKGVSCARNTGLDAARGEYIAFVDSDDFIKPTMYQTLLTLLQSSSADIAQCTAFSATEDGTPYRTSILPADAIRLEGDEVLLSHVRNRAVTVCVWDKLYRRSCFDGIRFVEGYMNEDVMIMSELCVAANRLVSTQEPLYYYRDNMNSFTRSKQLRKFLIMAKKEQEYVGDFLKAHMPPEHRDLTQRYLVTRSMNGYRLALEAADISKSERAEWQAYFRDAFLAEWSTYRETSSFRGLRLRNRMSMRVFVAFPHTYTAIYRCLYWLQITRKNKRAAARAEQAKQTD